MTRKWQQLVLPSDLVNLSTECIVSKIELLVKHIEAFHEELVVVSRMEQDLARLLVQQLNFIKMKSKVET